jgi:OOP family OmpA-OmpF porin
LADPDPNAEPVQKIQMREKVDLATLMANPDLAPLYHIIIAESENRITFNDPFFSKTRYVIIESKNEDGSYVYTVGNTAELTRLYDMFTELRDSGYTDVKIDQFNKEELKKEFVRTGKFIEPGNADKLNIEFANLKDIKFEYNSDVILEASKANLDYVAAMLKLENDFDVKINAHTCSMGKHEYNQTLSDRRAASVVRYFEEKGIARGRMLPEGFAETQPVATNLTEEGRQENRRVEFIIVFNNATVAENETK